MLWHSNRGVEGHRCGRDPIYPGLQVVEEQVIEEQVVEEQVIEEQVVVEQVIVEQVVEEQMVEQQVQAWWEKFEPW